MKHFFILILCGVLVVMAGGCSSENLTEENVLSSSDRALKVMVRSQSTGVERASSNDLYNDYLHLNDKFIPGESHIYIYHTKTNARLPDFRSEKAYDYVCRQDKEDFHNTKYYDGYEYDIFTANAGTPVLKTGDLSNEGDNFYLLEALYCPNVHRKQDIAFTHDAGMSGSIMPGVVSEDQSTYPLFASNDLMLAHGRLVISEVSDDEDYPVRFSFWHIMSLVVINIQVPLDDDLFGQGFGLNKMTWCKLSDKYRAYYVDYGGHMNNGEQYPVEIRSDVHSDVLMCRLDDPNNPVIKTTEDNMRVQMYRYCALIPQQQIPVSSVFCQFALEQEPAERGERIFSYRNINTGSDTDEQTLITLKEGYITELNLVLEPKRPAPILLSVQVVPWKHAYTVDFDLKEQ